MKIRLAAILVAVATVLATSATAHPRWQFGLKAGANLSSLRGDQAGLWLSGSDFQISGTLLDSNVGFIGGGYGRYQLGEKFALQLDALYSRKGGSGIMAGTATVTGNNNIVYDVQVDGNMEATLDYVEFPLLAVLSLPAADGLSFAPYGGVSFGVLAQANLRLQGQASIPLSDGTNRTQSFDQSYNIEKSVADTDVALVLGAVMEWDTKHGRFIIESRYSVSMKTVDSSGDKNIRNSTLSLMAGFAWGKGEEVEKSE